MIVYATATSCGRFSFTDEFDPTVYAQFDLVLVLVEQALLGTMNALPQTRVCFVRTNR